MDMTQKRAYEIAYLGCIGGMLSYCNAIAITELTTIEEFLESNLGMMLVESIARTLHLEKEEAVEFARFVFDDVAKALAKMEESRARAEHGVYL